MSMDSNYITPRRSLGGEASGVISQSQKRTPGGSNRAAVAQTETASEGDRQLLLLGKRWEDVYAILAGMARGNPAKATELITLVNSHKKRGTTECAELVSRAISWNWNPQGLPLEDPHLLGSSVSLESIVVFS